MNKIKKYSQSYVEGKRYYRTYYNDMNKADKKILNDFEKLITRDWGERCKTYSAMCYVCIVWRHYDDILNMYNT